MKAHDTAEWTSGPIAGMRGRVYFQPLILWLAFLIAAPAPRAAAQTPAPQSPAWPPPQAAAATPALSPAAPATTEIASPAPAPVTPATAAPAPRTRSAMRPQVITPAGNCIYQSGNYIIQLICTGNSLTSGSPPDSGLISTIQQFESDSIKQWLALYGLPNADSDVAFFYQYARTTTRTSIRSYMELRMIDIAYRLNSPGNSVSINEQLAYNWFRGRVVARLIAMDQDAVNDKNSWQNNRCGWKPDPDLEKAYGFSYIPCVGTEAFNTAPNKDYFVGAARKRNYENLLLSLIGSNAPVLPGHALAGGLHSGFAPHSSGSSSSSATPSAATILSTQDQASAHLLGLIGGITGGIIGSAVLTSIVCTAVPAIRFKIFPNSKKRDYLKNQRQARKPNADMEEEVQENSNDAKDTAVTEGDTTVETDAGNVVETVTEDSVTNVLSEGAEISALTEEETNILPESAAGGPIGVLIGVVVAIVVAVTTIIVDEAVAEASLHDLDNTLSNDQNNASSLDLYAMEQSDLGKYQIGVSWTEITWPELPSTASLPTANANDPVIYSYPAGSPNNTSTGVSFTDWNGVNWTVTGFGGAWFIENGVYHVPAGTTVPAGFPNPLLLADLNPTIQFTDWNGNQLWASRIQGNKFIVGERFVGSSDIPCPADSSGVTNLSDFTGCISWVVNSLPILANNNSGGTYNAVVGVATLPAISPATTLIQFNTHELSATYNIPVSGTPAPSVFADALPNGVTFTSGTAPNPGVFTVNASSVEPGTYLINLHAQNPAAEVTTVFTLAVTGPDLADPPKFTDATSTNENPNWTTGIPVDMTFHVLSGDSVTFSTNFSLPQGMNFYTSPGVNAIRIAGTPMSTGNDLPEFDIPLLQPRITACSVTFSNKCDIIPFSYTSVLAPAAHFTMADSPINLRFPANQITRYTLQTTGAITPVSFGTCFGPLPSWAGMTDNGNGSVTIYGNPDPTSNGVQVVYETNIVIHTYGDPDPICNHNNMEIFLDSTPQLFLTSATIQTGENFGIFLPSSLPYPSGVVSTTSPIPAGMSFNSPFEYGGSYSIGGNPHSGSGGQYNLDMLLTAPGYTQGVHQNFLITVNEPPSLNLPTEIFMMAGIPSQYVVKPGGFPTVGAMSVTKTGFLPKGLIFGSASQLNAITGQGVIKGTPDPSTAKTAWALTLNANNGIGSPATASTVLYILAAGDVNHDDKVDCNDVALVKAAFGAKAGTPQYNGAADVNGDGVVNVLDLTFVSSHLPAGTVCH